MIFSPSPATSSGSPSPQKGQAFSAKFSICSAISQDFYAGVEGAAKKT